MKNEKKHTRNQTMSTAQGGLPKAYEAKLYERDTYHFWENSGYFNPDTLPKKSLSSPKRRKRYFSIVMPPPNTTGILHLGHASAIAYEDLMVRYKRMRGYKSLFIPGTDHAAIATQNKVEKLIAGEGLNRISLGREKFLERVRSFVKESQGVIKGQIRSVGASCDWSREAYTFDEVSSRVVTEVFVRMYTDGLIYRGNRIVNWCVRCASTLADDEVKYIEQKTPFYYFKYGPVVIGTARPETKFKDKVIVVHPDDPRYQSLIGKEFDVPWIEGTVKGRLIADPIVDPKLGTGAMTITPAHSFEDFELAKKHKLDIEQIIGTDGRLTEAAGSMQGMTTAEARTNVVEKLKEKGLIDHIDHEYVHNLSVCYRCDTPVEPLVSRQWFVDVNKKIPGRHQSLKQLALDLVRRREIGIIPERFRKVYFHWLTNLHDWCISRQIWWGHRIPVWYCASEHIQVADERPTAPCPQCGNQVFRQDEDTLDTWFSSATWTFSTLLDRNYREYATFDEWLRKSVDLRSYHPTSVLETGYDILFFWVARMILVTSYVLKEKPFANVYLHGLVLDREGRKMSKSLDNGIDPIDVIAQYGADALRLSLTIGSAPGQDIRVYNEKIAGYRNFVNKLWNISRYILSSVDHVRLVTVKPKPATLAEKWIMQRWSQVAAQVTKHIDRYQFSPAGELLYSFTWHDCADWYLEISKIESKESPEAKQRVDAILLYLLQQLLVVWHPFTPFVTEVIWKEFKAPQPLMITPWPRLKKLVKRTPEAIKKFNTLQNVINEIRRVRAEHHIAPETPVRLKIVSKHDMLPHRTIIERLARCTIDDSFSAGELVRGSGFTLRIDFKIQVNEKKQQELRDYITRLEAKLANDEFIRYAPAAVIEQERKKLADAQTRLGV